MPTQEIGKTDSPYKKPRSSKLILLLLVLFIEIIVGVLVIDRYNIKIASLDSIRLKPNICLRTPSRIRKPHLSAISSHVIQYGDAIETDDVLINLQMEPGNPAHGDSVRFIWSFTDKSGAPIDLNRSIHNAFIHMYLMYEDMQTVISHTHPERESKQGALWSQQVTLNKSGEWRIMMQAGSEGVLYQVVVPIVVSGDSNVAVAPSVVREHKIDPWTVVLQSDPKIIRADEPTKIIFDILGTEEHPKPELCRPQLFTSHNIIFTPFGDTFFWNAHGDGSTREISAAAHMPIERLPIKEEPFGYIVTFPNPGIWMLHFEGIGQGTAYFVEVLDRSE